MNHKSTKKYIKILNYILKFVILFNIFLNLMNFIVKHIQSKSHASMKYINFHYILVLSY